jgi:LysM repeat protein
MYRKLILYVAVFLSFISPVLWARTAHAGSDAPSPYDLIDAVNGYRAANGLYALNPDVYVMSAAQAHAEWIVETGNGGHIGAGGSDETIRVSWTGYGNGAAIKCDEGWASGTNAEDVVYSSWADWVHQGVMLDYWGNGYTDIGAGVADSGNGRYVFVLNVCMVSGKPSTNRPTAVNTPSDGSYNGIIDPTADTSQIMMAVSKATPAADGSVIHTVQYGQSLVQIALAYGTLVKDIRQLNNMAEDNTLIYPEQKLVIFKGASNSTSSAPAENSGTMITTGTVEKTLDPTFTPRPKGTSTPLPEMVLPTMTPTIVVESPQGSPVQTAGLILVGICGVGILVYMGFSLKK